MLSLLLLLQVAPHVPSPPPPTVSEFCVRTTREKGPTPVDESYVVIGKTPQSGKLYSGSLTVHFAHGRYVLNRKTGKSSVTGEAFPVLCGPDKVRLLQVHYKTKPVATRFFCSIGANYDNYSVASCGPNTNRDQSITGIEAWFPSPGSEP